MKLLAIAFAITGAAMFAVAAWLLRGRRPTVPLNDWLDAHYAEHELAYREGASLDEMRLAGLL